MTASGAKPSIASMIWRSMPLSAQAGRPARSMIRVCARAWWLRCRSEGASTTSSSLRGRVSHVDGGHGDRRHRRAGSGSARHPPAPRASPPTATVPTVSSHCRAVSSGRRLVTRVRRAAAYGVPGRPGEDDDREATECAGGGPVPRAREVHERLGEQREQPDLEQHGDDLVAVAAPADDQQRGDHEPGDRPEDPEAEVPGHPLPEAAVVRLVRRLEQRAEPVDAAVALDVVDHVLGVAARRRVLSGMGRHLVEHGDLALAGGTRHLAGVAHRREPHGAAGIARPVADLAAVAERVGHRGRHGRRRDHPVVEHDRRADRPRQQQADEHAAGGERPGAAAGRPCRAATASVRRQPSPPCPRPPAPRSISGRRR